ncbi:MAG: DUF6164 family protein [Pseudomonadales bacterium]|nr:DUF6164 family protein [Pseudomonadales bacterium]
MAILLMKLRQVPEDELVDILRLLDEHEVDYYQTSAGAFGISLPALWLHDAAREDEAKALLAAYAEQRRSEARKAQAVLEAAQGTRTVFDIFREHPVKFSVRVLVILLLLWLSVRPFLRY